MGHSAGEPPSLAEVQAQVADLLAEGLRVDLSAPAAGRYAEACSQVLQDLGGADSLLAVKLLTARVVAGAQSPQGADAPSVQAAQQMAARLEDDELARAYALAAWCTVQQMPEHADLRRQAAQEILETAERYGEGPLVPVGYVILLVALLERGAIRELDVELMDRRHRAAGLPGSRGGDPVAWFTCLRSILDGEIELAERQAHEQYTADRREDSDALALYTTQLGMIGWMRGRVDGAEEGFLAARREHPEQLLWPASLVWLWLSQGRRAAAETLLRSLPEPDEIRQDRYWLSTITVLAEVAIITGSRARAQQLHGLLAPFADRLVPVGTGVAFWGTAARTLGLLEERLGMLPEALAHLEQAIEVAGRVGAQAWLAEAQIELAEFALRHHLLGVPVYDLLAQARATSQARGFTGLARRAVPRPRIRVLGWFEVTSLDGTTAVWASRKARELLKMLVAARGAATSREVLMHVLWPGESPAVLANRFSVAVNVTRRALDPQRVMPHQHHLVTNGQSVRLDLAHVDVDLERYFALADRPDEVSRAAALDLYSSGAFPDEPYADWAAPVQRHAQLVWDRLTQPGQETDLVERPVPVAPMPLRETLPTRTVTLSGN